MSSRPPSDVRAGMLCDTRKENTRCDITEVWWCPTCFLRFQNPQQWQCLKSSLLNLQQLFFLDIIYCQHHWGIKRDKVYLPRNLLVHRCREWQRRGAGARGHKYPMDPWLSHQETVSVIPLFTHFTGSGDGVFVLTVPHRWLDQIWEEDLHSSAWGARPWLHVQTPPGLNSHQPRRIRLHYSRQEDGWILGRRYFYNCQRCSHAARTKGPVSNTL